MILRKPYGFLIKYFRLIHLIITGILIFLVSFNNSIYLYLNSCANGSCGRYDAYNYIDYGIFIWIFIGILLLFIIFILFKYKNKPRRLYLVSILGYVALTVYMFILFGYFNELPNNILDQKVIRGYRDMMLVALCFQYLMIVIMFIRGLGFNIKKFNFSEDAHDLDLSKEDYEEVEVDFKIDTTDIMMNVRKKKREFGYYFQEYRVIILGLFAIILVIVIANVYNKFGGILKVYGQNEIVGNNNFVTVRNSYYNIDGDKNYVIIGIDLFKYGNKERLNLANMVLLMDGKKYVPNRNICYKFNELGNCYKKQFVTDKNSSYIIVYEVDSLNTKRSYLLYEETYEDKFKIKLNLKDHE